MRQEEIIKELTSYTSEDLAIIIGGISENKKYGNAFYNSLYCLANKEVQAVAHKMLLPTYDVFDETRYFEPSKKVTTWEWQGVKLGCLLEALT